MRKTLCCVVTVSLMTAVNAAEKAEPDLPPVDKSAYHFFNPTPIEYLRDMTIDGPGATESPYTVDAGHFQIEMALVSYSTYRQPFDGVTYRLEQWSIAPMILKVGLLNQLDLQVVLEPYNHVYEREDGFYQITRRGFGDTSLRIKYNLWGNDSGTTALAITPFVKFPTGQQGVGSDGIEGGLILPFAMELPWNFHLGLMTRLDIARNLGGSGYHAEFINSVVLARELFRDLEGYVEFFSNVSTERDTGWAGTFDTGLSYWLTDDLQLNAGVNIGLTRWADDWSAFLGVAWRY